MPLWSPYPSKPPLGAPIDWSRPLTRGLAAFYAMGAGSGLPADLVSTRQASLFSGSPAAWGTAGFGAGLASALGSGPLYSLPAVRTVDPGQDFTVMMLVQFTSFPADGSISGLWSAHSGGETPCFMRAGDGGLLAGQFQVGYEAGKATGPTPGFSVGVPYVIAMTITPAVGGTITQTGYVNGQSVCSQSQSFVTKSFTSAILWSDDAGDTARAAGAVCGAVGMWGRCLSAQEIGTVPSASALFGRVFGSPRAYSLYRRAVASPIVARRGLGGERAGSRGVA